MTANADEPAKDITRISITIRATERNDSTQVQPKPSASVQSATRRPSLAEAMRHAAFKIGERVCESQKDLRMLGVLPEPESDNDEVSPGAAATGLVQDDGEERDSVDAADSDGDQGSRTVIEPSQRDFEAERQERKSIQDSFKRFRFTDPPTPHHETVRLIRREIAYLGGHQCVCPVCPTQGDTRRAPQPEPFCEILRDLNRNSTDYRLHGCMLGTRKKKVEENEIFFEDLRKRKLRERKLVAPQSRRLPREGRSYYDPGPCSPYEEYKANKRALHITLARRVEYLRLVGII